MDRGQRHCAVEQGSAQGRLELCHEDTRHCVLTVEDALEPCAETSKEHMHIDCSCGMRVQRHRWTSKRLVSGTGNTVRTHVNAYPRRTARAVGCERGEAVGLNLFAKHPWPDKDTSYTSCLFVGKNLFDTTELKPELRVQIQDRYALQSRDVSVRQGDPLAPR